MNERIKELRKALGLSGEKFGDPLGVTKTAVSLIESGKNNLTDQMIKLICLTYNVNEHWLRTGEGDMFNDTKGLSIDEIIKTKSIDNLETDIIKAYFSLDKDIRKSVLEHFRDALGK